MKLKEILDSLVSKTIKDIYIGDCQLFPYERWGITFEAHGTEGYYRIMRDKICVTLLSIRNEKGDYIPAGYTVEYYSDDSIRKITFMGYKITFE